MEIRYRPPLNDVNECNWLESNMLTCLKEKSVQDQLPRRFCKVENLLWFFLECPVRAEPYENSEELRKIYIREKQKDLQPQATQPRKRR